MKQERIAFALKIMDGTEEGWPLIIASILEQIGSRTIDSLYRFAGKEIWNDNKQLVGLHRVVFQLSPVKIVFFPFTIEVAPPSIDEYFDITPYFIYCECPVGFFMMGYIWEKELKA